MHLKYLTVGFGQRKTFERVDVKTPELLKFLLGLKLRKLRFEKGLSLQALSQLSGLSSSYLNEIEKGKKYPKVDKLILLAKSLKIKLEDLKGGSVDKSIIPLTDFLSSDFFKTFPLETFGMNRGDLFDLMSNKPEKFASLIATFVGLARHYEMEPQEFSKLALRSYRESKEHHFPEVEEKALEFRRKVQNEHKGDFNEEVLTEFLKKHFNISVQTLKANKLPVWPPGDAIILPGKKTKVLFHEELDRPSRLFFLAKELGKEVFGFKRENFVDLAYDTGTFVERKNDLMSYAFACALLWPKDQFEKNLREFLGQKLFFEKKLLAFLEEGPFLPEIFIQRMTQIFPQLLGIKKLFYLRFETVKNPKKRNVREEDLFYVTDELHLSHHHFPHENRMGQHYCRRWSSLNTLKEWIDKGRPCRPETGYHGSLKVQKSKLVGSNDVYFCVTLATQKMEKGDFQGNPFSVTLGLALDDDLKEVMKFWDDPSIPEKTVGKTCETCPVSDCLERAVPASILKNKEKKDHERNILKAFLDKNSF